MLSLHAPDRNRAMSKIIRLGSHWLARYTNAGLLECCAALRCVYCVVFLDVVPRQLKLMEFVEEDPRAMLSAKWIPSRCSSIARVSP